MTKNLSLGVDAGNISFVDKNYILKNKGLFGETAKRMCKKFKVKPGAYNVHVHMAETWQGEIDKEFIIDIPSGTLCIGDMCYWFSSGEVDHDVWLKFLDKTDYMNKREKERFTIDTGGDGEFKVNFTLTEVK